MTLKKKEKNNREKQEKTHAMHTAVIHIGISLMLKFTSTEHKERWCITESKKLTVKCLFELLCLQTVAEFRK